MRNMRKSKIGSLRMELPRTGYIWTDIRFHPQNDAVIYARHLCRLPSGKVKCLWMEPVGYFITDEKGRRIEKKFKVRDIDKMGRRRFC